jgi:L-ascorbate metabolism protein UlaG (beta-lactamase superfamily)
MELTWFGLSCFRIVERGYASIVTDPYESGLGLPALKLRGDVVTISHNAQGHNHTGSVSGHHRDLRGPGEYEIGGVFITGIATTHQAVTTENVLFLFDYNGLTIAHLGDMSKVPTQTQIEALEQVNVLLVPVGSGNSLNAAQAAELVSMLEPSIVIPMHYHIPRLKVELDDVERFLKEMGVAEPDALVSLKVSSSTLPVETQVVLLQPKLKEN